MTSSFAHYRCACTCLALAVVLAPLQSKSCAAPPPRQWAVLIGVQEHTENALNLRYTENDVEKLRRVLVERAGLSDDRILRLTDGTVNRQPTKANIARVLPDFLEKAGPEDRVIVFFSGHG
jgi:uncharacterized caspase-like protein